MPEQVTPQPLTGVVLAAQANFYRVQLDSASSPSSQASSISSEQILCTRRSRLKKIGQQVVVGDRVMLHQVGERGVIEAVTERRSFLSRPPIANIDQALVVQSLADPPLEPVQLSRFLVHAEASRLSVRICLNKCDRVTVAEQEAWRHRLQSWGYTPILLSATTQMGLSELRQVCQDQISVVMGLSGVGKSTLLNHLLPDVTLSTQAVSGRLRHGRHTTRHVELFPLGTDPHSGWIADSPGFNQADLTPCQAHTLIAQFPEVRHMADRCQFRDCLHQQEPGCQVRSLNWERYPIYLAHLEEVLSREELEQASTTPEESIKPKSSSGKTLETLKHKPSTIPRLHSSYRQCSRRQVRQDTHRWLGDTSDLVQDQGENP